MVKCIVISDEITGGSSVGALLEKNQNKVCALINPRSLRDPMLANFDCVVYSTNSRNLTKEQSYQLVFYAARLLKSYFALIYAKRIDPSMRGNTCTETQAMLDALGDKDRVAIVVPAFPALNRSNVGGYILVDGKPLQKSLIGLEDLSASQSGRVADLFTEKFKYKTQTLHLKELLHGAEYLAKRIIDLANDGVRAIVLDSVSQEDINLIADAVLLSKIKFLAVDPGPFTATLSRKVMKDAYKKDSKAKIFGVVGGSNPLISAQVELLRLEEKPFIVSVRNKELLGDAHRRATEIGRVVNQILVNYENYNVAFAVSDHLGSNPDIIINFEQILEKTGRTKEEAIDLISAAYGEIAYTVLSSNKDIKALYSTGAEYTVAICRELKCNGLRLQGQVKPLTAYATVLDGPYDGLKYVTSASSATNTDTLVDSIQYLKRKLEL